MNEEEWLTCTSPAAMLQFLGDRASERKLRLFACACCRRAGHLLADERTRRAVEMAERYADGLVTEEELARAADAAADAASAALTSARSADAVASAAAAASNLARAAAVAADYAAAGMLSAAFHLATATGAPSAAIAREAERAAQAGLVREMFGNPFHPVRVEASWLTWSDGTVVKVAQAIYDGRRWQDLPILADALEDAGCDDEDILNHCRSGGLHVPGCWALDLLLGRK